MFVYAGVCICVYVVVVVVVDFQRYTQRILFTDIYGVEHKILDYT